MVVAKENEKEDEKMTRGVSDKNINDVVDMWASNYTHISGTRREYTHTKECAFQIFRSYADGDVHKFNALKKQFYARANHYISQREKTDPRYKWEPSEHPEAHEIRSHPYKVEE